MPATLARIVRYPVKGLTGQELASAELEAGGMLPDDRRFALMHGASGFDPAAPEWKPKSNFLMLARNERLALLEAAYDPADATLSLSRGGRRVARGRLGDPTGRRIVEQFLEAYLGEEAFGRVRVVEVPGHAFADVPDRVVSVLNLASCRDLERVVNAPVDPRRFRANLLVDGWAPWAEFEMVGRTLSVGGVRLEVTGRIDRCAATQVDPDTGERDLQIPLALRRAYGHIDCGVYARVVAGGRIAAGDAVEAVP